MLEHAGGFRFRAQDYPLRCPSEYQRGPGEALVRRFCPSDRVKAALTRRRHCALRGIDTVVTRTRIHLDPAPRWNTIASKIVATLPKALAAVPTIFSACTPVASIFRFDTSSGGGKTRGLIALVHAVRSGRTIPNIGGFVDAALLPTGRVRIAAYDGENADPSNGRKMGCCVLAHVG